MNSPLEHPMLGTTNPRTKKFMHSITATLASRVESNAEVRIYMAGRSKVAICPPPVVIFTFYRSDSHSFLQTSFVPEQTTWGAQFSSRNEDLDDIEEQRNQTHASITNASDDKIRRWGRTLMRTGGSLTLPPTPRLHHAFSQARLQKRIMTTGILMVNPWLV